MPRDEEIHTVNLRELVGPWDFKERKYLPSLTWTQELNFVRVMGSVPFKALWWALRYMLPSSRRSVSLKRRVVNKIMAYVMTSISIPELRIILPVVPLRVFLESRALRTWHDQLPNYNHYFDVQDASARWLCEVPDRKTDDPVILYLHGGAYFLKTMPEQVSWLGKLTKALPHHRLSVLEVDYTVSPQAHYPCQLNEALATYEQLAKSCSKIILLGDSAGGNLAAALTAHIVKNNLPVVRPWGVVLVSAWTELEHTNGSMDTNKEYDYLDFTKVDEYSLNYAGSKEELKNPYVNMWVGGKEFWHNVFPKRTMAVWGDRELLRDACQRFVRMSDITQTFEEPHGVHDVLIVGFKAPSAQYIVQNLDRWLSEPERDAPGLPAPQSTGAKL